MMTFTRSSLLLCCAFSPLTALASGLHISPDIKLGPYWQAGVSGAGLQLGVNDIWGLDALYISYSHLSAEHYIDKDRLKTYRIGTQHLLVNRSNKMALQLEAGLVEYQGVRDYILTDKKRYAEGTGGSVSAAWVMFVNDSVGFRAGMDVNYINQKNTLFGTHWSTTFNTGVVLHF